MNFGNIAIALLLAAAAAYSGRNLVKALRSGTIAFPGGRSHDRARRPRDFWMAAGFEGIMFVIFVAMLVRQLA